MRELADNSYAHAFDGCENRGTVAATLLAMRMNGLGRGLFLGLVGGLVGGVGLYLYARAKRDGQL